MWAYLTLSSTKRRDHINLILIFVSYNLNSPVRSHQPRDVEPFPCNTHSIVLPRCLFWAFTSLLTTMWIIPWLLLRSYPGLQFQDQRPLPGLLLSLLSRGHTVPGLLLQLQTQQWSLQTLFLTANHRLLWWGGWWGGQCSLRMQW